MLDCGLNNLNISPEVSCHLDLILCYRKDYYLNNRNIL